MPIVCVGVDHRTAPVAVRERLSFAEHEHRDVLSAGGLAVRFRPAGLTEFALLSTCNRTELYAAAGDASHRFPEVPPALALALAELRGADPAELRDHLYAHAGPAAVHHLCRVASGLDSMILGESEILGQVSRAHEAAAAAGAAGIVLQAAFQTAVRAGRRARCETSISRHSASVGSEAVRVLKESGCDLASARVLVVGTGEMGRLAGRALRAQGAGGLSVVSRTSAHAELLAAALGATALAWHALEAAIREADVVVSVTGAPHAVITTELVRAARLGAGARPLRFVDLAVPRDVEPAVRHLPGVTVYDLDDVQARLDGHLEDRRREIPEVERIVAEELARFEDWCRGEVLRPLLAEMRMRSEAIRREEVERASRRLGDVPDHVREQFEAFSRTLVGKLLHEPTRRLRDEPDPERREAFARVTRHLLGMAADAPGSETDSGGV